MTSYIEGRIIRHLVRNVLNAGYAVDVNDNDGDRETHAAASRDYDAIVAAIFNLDIDAGDYCLDLIKDGQHIGWIRLIEGNGASVINDYTTNLEDIVAPTNKFSDQIDDNEAKWLRDELATRDATLKAVQEAEAALALAESYSAITTARDGRIIASALSDIRAAMAKADAPPLSIAELAHVEGAAA